MEWVWLVGCQGLLSCHSHNLMPQVSQPQVRWTIPVLPVGFLFSMMMRRAFHVMIVTSGATGHSCFLVQSAALFLCLNVGLVALKECMTS